MRSWFLFPPRLALLVVIALSAPLSGQTAISGDSVLVTPGTRYDIPAILAPILGDVRPGVDETASAIAALTVA